MSEQFNVWFSAIVVALVISLIAAAVWELIRRRTWTFVSRFWPGVLSEVGLDRDRMTRVGEKQKQREVTNQLSALSHHIITALAKPPDASLMAQLIGSSDYSSNYDVEAQTGTNPVYQPSCNTTFTATAYFPDETPTVIINQTQVVFNRYEIGTTKRWKSSIVLQACLPVDPRVLAEIAELAKDCLHAENRCTFQLGNWAILYHNAGSVHIRELTEGDVPVNVEARWQEQRAGITMSGLFLTGAQVKVATEETSVTLRDDGPASQGTGDLDELFLPVTDQVDVPEDDSLIYASKVVQADGITLTVRSEATCILPPWERSLRESIWDRLQRISLSAKKMIKSLLRIEDHRLPELLTPVVLDSKPSVILHEVIAEHWKGVSKMELLKRRKEVLYHLHELSRFDIRNPPHPPFRITFTRDQYSLNYWQRGLHDLNKVIFYKNCQQNPDALQRSLYFSIRGAIKFLLLDFEGAIQDFNHAFDLGHGSLILFDRALAKGVLARYSEAMEDVLRVHGSLDDIQELRTCLQQILLQRSLPLSITKGAMNAERPEHSDQRKSEPISIPDLLTGGEWCSPPEDGAQAPFVQRKTTSSSDTSFGPGEPPPTSRSSTQLGAETELLDTPLFYQRRCPLDQVSSDDNNFFDSTHDVSKNEIEADPEIIAGWTPFIWPNRYDSLCRLYVRYDANYAAIDVPVQHLGQEDLQDMSTVLGQDLQDHGGITPRHYLLVLKKLRDGLLVENPLRLPNAREYARILERLSSSLQTHPRSDLSDSQSENLSVGHRDQVDALVHLAEDSEDEGAVKRMEQEDLEAAVRNVLGLRIQDNVITARHFRHVLEKLREDLLEVSHGMPHGPAFARILQSLIAPSEESVDRDREEVDYRDPINSASNLLKSGIPTQECSDPLKVTQIQWANWPSR